MSIWEDVLGGRWGCAIVPGTAHTLLFQERTGASAGTPADADGDPVGTIRDLISGVTITMPSDDARPLYRVAGSIHWLECRPDGSPAFSRIQAVLAPYTGTTMFGIAAARPSNLGRFLSVGIDDPFAHDWNSYGRAELVGHNAVEGVGLFRNGISTRHGGAAIGADIVAETLTGPTDSESVRDGGAAATASHADIGGFDVNAIGFMSAAGAAREWSTGRLYAALVVGGAPSASQRAALLAAARGRITGGTDGQAAGTPLIAAASLVPGDASGERSPTLAGEVLARDVAVLAGAAAGLRSPTIEGRTLAAHASLVPGIAGGQRSPSVAGQTVALAAVLVAGAGSASRPFAGSRRERVLRALFAVLDGARPAGATLLREAVLPERVPAAGLLILRDGDPGEPEVTLSPLAYHYQHRAEIEAVVQGGDRDAAFDTLCASIGAALAADRTLGGLCDWVEAEAPRPVDLPVEGAASLKAAVIPVVLHYSTADPLG